MLIIKVDAIESTNTFLRDLNREKPLDSSTCIIAKRQLKGKGQRGTVWQSNPEENLTCSVFMKVNDLQLNDQFYISMLTSLAVYDTLKEFGIKKIAIKWPNDILSGKKKICGILIENVVKNGSFLGTILGIGLNINQVVFLNLPRATSLKKILNCDFNIENVLDVLLSKLEKRFESLYETNFECIKNEYEGLLFRKDKPSTFIDHKGKSFTGIIKTVTNEGKLRILLEDNLISNYDLKEITLRY